MSMSCKQVQFSRYILGGEKSWIGNGWIRGKILLQSNYILNIYLALIYLFQYDSLPNYGGMRGPPPNSMGPGGPGGMPPMSM